MKYNSFWKSIKEYFSVYLPKQKNSSEKTIHTSQMAWNLFLHYIIYDCHIPISEMEYKTFTKELVLNFLDTMENEKKWKPSTRNNRLSCIRSFFKYAGCNCSEAYIVYADLGTIPMKKGVDNSRVVNHLSKDALFSIFDCIDSSSKKGLRDKFFLMLMYDTGARNGEMLKLKLSDINTKNETACLFGKGSKPRLVPLTKDTISMFEEYRKVYHREQIPNGFLFYTIHKGERTPMSDDNVARFLSGYAKKAHILNDDVPLKVHPHMIRHSRAMHLYKGGMALSVLSEFLGHENPETTLIYAYADTDMKRKAIEMATENLILPGIDTDNPIWEDNDIIGKLVRGY